VGGEAIFSTTATLLLASMICNVLVIGLLWHNSKKAGHFTKATNSDGHLIPVTGSVAASIGALFSSLVLTSALLNFGVWFTSHLPQDMNIVGEYRTGPGLGLVLLAAVTNLASARFCYKARNMRRI
jgi:hypothetical protein